MPSKPPKACSCPGCSTCNGRCPNTTRAARCTDCTVDLERTKPHDADRKKIYNSARWKGLRRQVKRETPWCAEPGCTRLWTQLDHEPPLRDLLARGLDPYARKHVQPLCTPHHSAKTMHEVRARHAQG